MGSSFHIWSLHIVPFDLVLTSNSRSLVRKFFSSQWYSNISGGPTDFSVASSNSIFDILANSPTFSWSDKCVNKNNKNSRNVLQVFYPKLSVQILRLNNMILYH